jgi:lipopolysaccharide transport system permease protein
MSPLVDFAVAFLILVAMMAWYGMTPTWGILALPLFLGVCLLTALAITLWLSALCVRYRDVAVVIPFLVQVWMYVSPIAYPASLVPEKWRLLYALNPMVGVIEGFRWALLGKVAPDFGMMAASAAAFVLVLYGGLVYFKHMERTFADVV